VTAEAGAGEGLRIRFVTRKWPPAMGGMETYCVELTGALARLARVEVEALPGRADGAPPRAGALIGFGLRAGLGLLVRRPAEDVVHVGDLAAWPLALAARLRAPGRVAAISAHGTDAGYMNRPTALGRLYGRYLRLGARLLPGAALIANSQATAEAVAAAGFPRPAVVPLATGLRGAPADGAHDGRVLFAGRLVARKGCRWFVEQVLPRLPEAVTLDVAGSVWDPEEGAALAHPRVRFLGRLSQAELARRAREALCVVVPNIAVPSGEFEGFGLAATEAAAAGGLALAADRDGLREAVRDGETGFLLPSGDAEAWAAKIREIRGWPAARRAAFLDRAMAVCRAEYSWDRVARDTLAVYRRAGAG
jgi:glycosyltransferase involved in cell wall biosynthesis